MGCGGLAAGDFMSKHLSGYSGVCTITMPSRLPYITAPTKTSSTINAIDLLELELSTDPLERSIPLLFLVSCTPSMIPTSAVLLRGTKRLCHGQIIAQTLSGGYLFLVHVVYSTLRARHRLLYYPGLL